MKKWAGVWVLALLAVAVSVAWASEKGKIKDPFPWAYGFPTSSTDAIAPPCPADAKPHDCSLPGRPWPDDGTVYHLSGTDRAYTISQIQSFWAPADWYPNEHPPAPDIVKYGHEQERLRACAHCHYFNGQGKPENAHLAGLPYKYILEQIALFRAGGRRSADPRKGNSNEMVQIARFISDAEADAAARYFSSLEWNTWVKVVESTTAPKTRQSAAGAFLSLASGETEPLGNRIIEVPQNTDLTERMRDPHSGYVAYVPVGSVEKGKALVNTGVAGKITPCTTCHGQDLLGHDDIPPIAGRTASYTIRQLYNFQQGTRQSVIMKPVVANMSADDMIDVVAYLASR